MSLTRLTLPPGLLLDILDNPEDDFPRLISADWFEDHGDVDRAELIRLQIERSRTSLPQPSTREQELLKIHAATWASELPSWVGVVGDDFERGFVEGVRDVAPHPFATRGQELFSRAPIRRVRFQPSRAGLRLLARCPWLARLWEVSLANCSLGPSEIEPLLWSPFWNGLRSLLLHNNDLGDTGASLLAEVSDLTALRELYLSGNGISDEGTVALARSDALRGLHVLDLRDNTVSNVGLGALASHPHPHLETLFLVNNRIGDDGVLALASSPHLPSLRDLYLNHNPIGNIGAAALAGSSQMSHLRCLDLRNAYIGPDGGIALATSPFLGQIEELLLNNNPLGWSTVALLRERFGQRVRTNG